MSKDIPYIDAEEKLLIEQLDNREWQSATTETRQRFIKAAQNTLLKDKRMNIRISSHDYEGLRLKAAEEGMPYQTLVASVLHKYVSGRLIEA
jgi:predicted DNA binding CopG/RHH family protein